MKKSLLAAGILIVIGLAISLCVLMQCDFDWNLFSTEEYITEEINIDEAFDAIVMHGTSCDVQFLPGEVCTIEYHGEEPSPVETSVDNGTLSIIFKEQTDNKKWYDHIGVLTVSPQITVYLPSGRLSSLAVSLESGEIFVDGGLQLGGTTLSTASGEIEISDSSCETLMAKTDSGEIFLDNVTCEKTDLQSHSGDVNLQSLLAEQMISVKTDSGDISFSQCDSHHIEAKASSGDVSGSFLTEKCFVAVSSSGDVHVPKSQAEDQCLITTSSGDIDFT